MSSEDFKKGSRKRPKSYYQKCARAGKRKSRKHENILEPGIRGFLVTCNSHEKEAVRETYNILNEYADELYGPEQMGAEESWSDTNAYSDNDAGSEEDIEKSLEREVHEMKEQQKNPGKRRFQNVFTKAKNCIFIKTHLEDPCMVAHTILSDLAEKKVQKTRYALRLLPIAGTCKAYMKDIQAFSIDFLEKTFGTPFGVGLSYTNMVKIRNNNSVGRTSILTMLGKIIKEMNPLHRLNHSNPDIVVLVEVIGSVCCMSVVRDYFNLRKYNLLEVTKAHNEIENVKVLDSKLNSSDNESQTYENINETVKNDSQIEANQGTDRKLESNAAPQDEDAESQKEDKCYKQIDDIAQDTISTPEKEEM
ncbi:hypothetical protein CHS0354_028810 [Potamilus streckersoni]|uniref:THUMP domain-containing protein n=1 Tax=Potamilus streckersoni TaxID=2493646 RepID=A0AAE0W2K4_9BIVA|nr:hypothetical protein CHS0354_028810 [Potamilus streckersoni]